MSRFNLVDSTIASVINLFYDLVSNAYMTPVTITPDTIGRYSNAGTGTWTAANNQLTFVGMNTPFSSQDLGKTIAFRVGTLIYIGTINLFVSATVVGVNGLIVPTTNQTLDAAWVIPSAVNRTSVNISTLRVMRTSIVKMYLESTSTPTVDAISLEEIFTWQPQADKNQNRLVWAYNGQELLLAKGNNLVTFGTLTLHYPRIPDQGTFDQQPIDVPDGALIDLCLMKFDMLVAEMMNKPVPDRSAAMFGMVQALFSSLGREIQHETIVEKVNALI